VTTVSDPAEHQLLEAAVSATEGDVWFHVGEPQDWYGQHIALHTELPAGGVDTAVATPRTFKKVRAVTLASILEPLDEVDLIDIDIQGAEAEVLAASVEALHAKVKMLSVGTHIIP
jgi:FkbM family methyltransferase